MNTNCIVGVRIMNAAKRRQKRSRPRGATLGSNGIRIPKDSSKEVVLGKRLKRVPKSGNPLEPMIWQGHNPQLFKHYRGSSSFTCIYQHLEDDEEICLEHLLRSNRGWESPTGPYLTPIRSCGYHTCKDNLEEKSYGRRALQVAVLAHKSTPSGPQFAA
jgi:hypothetical protein